MTFLWVDNQGLPPRHLGGSHRFERRIDERTAGDITDALRAGGTQAAAMAMEHLHVDMDLALRVLSGARKRRSVMQDAVQAAYRTRGPMSGDTAIRDRLAPELARL
jgi:Arc/MetJ family transcription regulator